MRRAVLGWALDRAAREDEVGFATVALPRLERSIPPTRRGAELARGLADDDRWTARYLAGVSLARLVPRHLAVDDAWEVLMRLAGDEAASVRQAAAIGVGRLVLRCPEEVGRLEGLLRDPAADLGQRGAALRSLALLAADDATADDAERLLRETALSGDRLAPAVRPVITRGLGARDPERARAILERWAAGDDAALRAYAGRALERWDAADGGWDDE